MRARVTVKKEHGGPLPSPLFLTRIAPWVVSTTVSSEPENIRPQCTDAEVGPFTINDHRAI